MKAKREGRVVKSCGARRAWQLCVLGAAVSSCQALAAGLACPRETADTCWTNVVPETWTQESAPEIRSRPGSFQAVEIPDCGPAVRCRVRKINGTPQFVVDGRPVYPLWGTVRSDKMVRHSGAPLNFVTVWNSSKLFWPRGMEFDPASLDFNAARHLRMYPDAMMVWDITLYIPKDWSSSNPDDVARNEQGEANRELSTACAYSFASEKALAAMETMLAKVIRHVEASPYANRVAGYRVNSGHTAEWLGWHCCRKGSVLDFSPVAARGFAEFAAKFHPSISDRSVPTFDERTELDSPWSVVWDQRRHMKAVAYHRYYSGLVADAAARLCRKARLLAGEDKLIGTYFGYVMTLHEGGASQMLAHYATKRFLDATEGVVDFLMSPPGYSYGQRGLGDTQVDMKPFASIQDHGMVSVVEDDTRTHMNPRGTGYQATLTEWQSRQVHRRNMGIALCRNMPYYTYAITSGMDFDYPSFASDGAILRKAGEHAVSHAVKRAAEVAYVISEESILSMPMMTKAGRELYSSAVQAYNPDGSVLRMKKSSGAPFCGCVYGKTYNELAMCGAPVDYRLAEDLLDHPGDYRLYVFSGCFRYDSRMQELADRLRERDCTIVWAYGPGIVSAEGDPLENMRRLTGMDVVPVSGPMDCEVTCKDGLKFGGVGHPVSPLFAVEKPQAAIGTYENGEAGLALARTGRAKSVFCGTYRLEMPFLRAMARLSDVHVYTTGGDPMEANSAFFALHARTAGRKTVRLPRKADVVNVFAGELVARNVDEFSFDAELNSSWLFYYGADASKLARGVSGARKGTP